MSFQNQREKHSEDYLAPVEMSVNASAKDLRI